MRATAIRLYENFFLNFKNTEGWLEDITCNIGVKEGCPFSPTLFGTYIDKLEGFLIETDCTGMMLACIFSILFIYVDNIVLLERW